MNLHLRTNLILFLVFTLLFGFVYPGAVTLLNQFLFPAASQGSLVTGKDGNVLGSALIGQNFSEPQYFWGRRSATTPVYNAANSGGSNLGAANPLLLDAVKARVAALKKADPNNKEKIPVDLVTASGSGLDPHISLAAANYQAARVAKARGLPIAKIYEFIKKYTEPRQLNILGEARVNVLLLNLALDGRI